MRRSSISVGSLLWARMTNCAVAGTPGAFFQPSFASRKSASRRSSLIVESAKPLRCFAKVRSTLTGPDTRSGRRSMPRRLPRRVVELAGEVVPGPDLIAGEALGPVDRDRHACELGHALDLEAAAVEIEPQVAGGQIAVEEDMPDRDIVELRLGREIDLGEASALFSSAAGNEDGRRRSRRYARGRCPAREDSAAACCPARSGFRPPAP